MSNAQRLTVNSSSITPLINNNDTQIIFQRHCNYDRNNGGLINDSIDTQQSLAETFIQTIIERLDLNEFKNTYFFLHLVIQHLLIILKDAWKLLILLWMCSKKIRKK